MIINLAQIAAVATSKVDENDAFCSYLKAQNSSTIDKLVAELNIKIEPEIDCTTCGNCCKTLMINVTENEALSLSKFFNKPIDDIKAEYLEQGLNNQYIINQMPCTFLSGTKCSIYSERFAGCREFPALEQKNFTQRLFTIFMHYGRCPIIFNVVEALKEKTNFSK